MLISLIFCFLIASALSAQSPAPLSPSGHPRVTASFDANWRFLKADAPGAEKADFADASWRVVSVPHDWSIEGPFDANAPAGGAGAFLPTGVGWYRKNFTLPSADSGKRVFIDFDGVMANSEVWINGVSLGKRPYGYVSFRYEMTGHLNFGPGQTNVLAVRADTSAQPASRWYAGSGIYRHVRLVVTDPVHLGHWATFVTTPQVSAAQATVHIASAVVNQSAAPRRVSLLFTLLSPGGTAVRSVETAPQMVPAGGTTAFGQDIPVASPRLWNLDSPAMYQIVTQVRATNATLDDEITPFGIREFHFEAATGFWLNGKNLKLKGVCIHDEAGAVGAAVPSGVWERHLAALKQLGVNAIRTSHNPFEPQFLDLCDRMGFLVMDEYFDCWTVAKNPYDYHLYFRDWSLKDAEDMVRRDRNHPGIILYSAGNEIHDTPNAPLAHQILASLITVYHGNDPTRPVTQALFRPNASHDYDNGLADMLDVIGTNYRDTELLAAQAAKPTRKIVGTEYGHDRRNWLNVRDNAGYSGQFLWTGIDYLGESRAWPRVGSGSGLLDRTAIPHPMAFERQSWWSETPVVTIARRTAPSRATPLDPGFTPLARGQGVSVDWTPANLDDAHMENVEVYSNCEQVELFLNGKSLGTKPRPADESARTWQVPFAPGIIKAVGSNQGKAVASDELRTAGKPAKILLTTDRDKLADDWDDVAFVRASVVDENGVLIPGATDLITFQTTGPGQIAATDNGDQSSHASFQAQERPALGGRCLAILKATAPSGQIHVTASAPGLTTGSVTITCAPAPEK